MADNTPAALRLEPLRLQLQGLVDRMQALMMAKAVSPVAREGGDCAAAVFLPDGRLLAQARSLPLLLGSLIPAVAGLLARFPVDTMAPGDGYLLNDPWSGGSHLPDLVLLQPVFVDGTTGGPLGTARDRSSAGRRGGQLIALAATILHHQDVGGISPGSVPPHASSIHDEGLRLMPLQSHRHGQLDGTLEAVLRGNSRTPDTVLADLAAQWSAGEQAERELRALAARLGPRFEADGQALLEQAAQMTRQTLAAEPDGEWSWQDALDDDGLGSGPVPLRVMLRKHGDRLTIDFTGSAAQTRGPVNASRSSMLSAVLYFMRTLAPEAPNNAGCLEALDLVLPEGSVVNPRWPAAVNARTATVKLACNALLAAWGGRGGKPSAASHAGVATVLAVGGERADGRRWFFTEIIASGAGGHAGGAGAPGLSTDVGNARNLPIEVLETLAPVRMLGCGRRSGSGGAGLHRGGDGLIRDMLLLEGRAQVSYRGERHLHAAPGQAGGGAGACSQATLWRADGSREALGSRAQFEWRAGDRFCIETAGGGGWGGPALAADEQITSPIAGNRVPQEFP